MMNKIPKGWEVKKLGDIAITSSGGTPLRTHSEYWNGNIKWLKISDLNDSLIDNSDEFITEIGLKNSSAKILKKGTLLVAMYGSIGKLGILNTEATTNQAICAIINKKDKKFEIKFLFYFFMSAKEKMLNESFGGVQKNISQTYLKNLEIPLPNLTEQKAIADKLDDSFAKIENAITNLINAKENLKLYKQSVLKSAFNGDLLPNTSPTHWEVKKLGEISNYGQKKQIAVENLKNDDWILELEDIEKESPRIIPLWEVEIGKNYAMVISTSSGLWRYMIGDTIKFTQTKPYKFIITGRTKFFINAFGEELIIDNAEHGLKEACEATGAQVLEYTAAPVYMDAKGKCHHQWLIEFSKEPDSIEHFSELLDMSLQKINSDYEAKRYKDITLQPLEIVVARKDLFNDWLKSKGKLGGQHKVPRLCNTRKHIDELLTMNY